MACFQKFLIFGIFKACISNFAYTNLENIKKYGQGGALGLATYLRIDSNLEI